MPSGHPRGQAGYPDFLLFGEKKRWGGESEENII
jgi:hypothetical protein